MIRIPRSALALVLVSMLSITASLAQNTPPDEVLLPLSEKLLNRLSPEVRDKAKDLLTFTERYQKALLALPDDELKANIVGRLAREREAMDLVLSVLETESSAKVRLSIIRNWHMWPHWRSYPQTTLILTRLITTDVDPRVSLRSLEVLRLIRMEEVSSLLAERIKNARAKGDYATVKQLAQEQERWISLERGTMLPAFLRAVPPLFIAKSGRQRVRVLAFGDFGYGTEAQKRMASAMLKYHRRSKFDFGITTGDNFYVRGMESPDDPRWETQWERLYKPLGIKFYASLGNHDWAHPDSPAAEILYSLKSDTWRMPAPYYAYMAGPVQFFALDTNEVSEAQLIWLRDELMRSRTPWKVVYGHHPLYSAGAYGENKELIVKLLPILQEGHVDVYLSGHDHNLQHLKPEGGVQFFISGGGGMATYPLNVTEPRLLFGKAINGFTVLEASATKLIVKHVGAEAKDLYSYTLSK